MKTKTQHTPGPWPLTVLHGDSYELTITTAQGNHYATTFDPSAARLIAAAPDLLEVAKNAAYLANIYKDKSGLDGLVANALDEIEKITNKAIAKAEGK